MTEFTEKRLLYHNPTFVNQRLIRFTPKPDFQINKSDIVHALMNSLIGMFMIEASGFGRGLGVLDLNAKKLSNGLHILNFHFLEENKEQAILQSFQKLKTRKPLPIIDELEQPDRIKFETTVFESFGIQHLYKNIKDSLLNLYKIRKSIN